MLQTLDQHWREHLSSLDHLRQGIHLRGYAQKNPKQEYKREAFELFSDMLDRIKQDVVARASSPCRCARRKMCRRWSRSRPSATCSTSMPITSRRWRAPMAMATIRRWPSQSRRRSFARGRRSAATIRARAGQGKKYKHCHGRLG